MLFLSLVLIFLGLGTVIYILKELRGQNDIIIEILDNIYNDFHKTDNQDEKQ